MIVVSFSSSGATIVGIVALKRLVCFLLLSLCLEAQNTSRHVILVSLDGFSNAELQDPQVSAPNLRALAQQGFMARDGMLPVNPTLTWPNHTALVTGVDASAHGVLHNGLPSRPAGKPVEVVEDVPKTTLVLVPTVYDAATQAGLSVAELDWVAIGDAPSVRWSFAENPKPDSVAVREMVQAGVVTEQQIKDFAQLSVNVRDEIWTQSAIELFRSHRPHLTLLHLLTTDDVQHEYGPGTLAAQTALAFADRQVGRLIDGLKKYQLLDQVTLIVVSDHGFHGASKIIRPGVELRRLGLTGPGGCRVCVMATGGTAFLYIADEEHRAELERELPNLFRGISGIERVITPAEYSKFGYPAPGPGSRMADLVLAATDDAAFRNGIDGELITTASPKEGHHGYLRTHSDMRVILVAAGPGIRPGATITGIRNTDIAPTIAALLGIHLPSASGRVLKEILQ